ncbi:MAG: hypothetical protein Q8K82_04950 [Gemmatimonadaceae bacterium]|nr:hypothetical protein [Gemmatimonadaceae bacterium]
MSTLCLAASLRLGASAAAQNTDSTAAHAGMRMQTGVVVSALLTGPLGTRSPVGTVAVTGLTVRVEWAGDRSGATRPWYVHKGSCNRDEGMVGAASSYTPIEVDARGNGISTAALDAPLVEGNSYFVAVHDAGPGATAGIVACGELAAGSVGVGRMGGQKMDGMPMGDSMTMDDMPGMSASRSSGRIADTSTTAMDHSAMNMPEMQPTKSVTPKAVDHSRIGQTARANPHGADSWSSILMAIHMRMMTDPVIRERAMADSVLRRMMAQMPAEYGDMLTGDSADPKGATGRPAVRTRRAAKEGSPRAPATSGNVSHEGMNMRGVTMPAKPVAKPQTKQTTKSVTKPAQESAAKPAVKPAVKPAPKPAPSRILDSMPGMDHSKMPGVNRNKKPGMDTL